MVNDIWGEERSITIKKNKKVKVKEPFCPNCGKARLVWKELPRGTLEEKKETKFMYECPNCRVLFHKEQLGF